jgi:hypothetical protein
MKNIAFLLLFMLFGCLNFEQDSKYEGTSPTYLCDRPYPKDMQNGTIIAVYQCSQSHRLVFDEMSHNDFYVDGKSVIIASCPEKNAGEQCERLLKSCNFINLCR